MGQRVELLPREAATFLTFSGRRRARTGLRQLQDSYVQLYRSTRVFRAYSPTLILGLVQTEGYAAALLSANARLLNIPDDGAEAAAACVERSLVDDVERIPDARPSSRAGPTRGGCGRPSAIRSAWAGPPTVSWCGT